MSRIMRLRAYESRLRFGTTVEITESCRPSQLFAVAGAHGINGLAPCCGIFFIDQLRDGELVEIRVAEKLRAIVERPPECLHTQVHGIRRAAAHFPQIVTFKNIERFQQRDPAGARRGSTE